VLLSRIRSERFLGEASEMPAADVPGDPGERHQCPRYPTTSGDGGHDRR